MQTRVILPKLLLIAAILFGFNTAVADEAAPGAGGGHGVSDA